MFILESGPVQGNDCFPFNEWSVLFDPTVDDKNDSQALGALGSDQTNENRVVLRQTLLEIHRFISRRNSSVSGSVGGVDENLCLECGGDKVTASKVKSDSLKVETNIKQTPRIADKDIEDQSNRNSRQPKPKQHGGGGGSVFSKLGSYRQKKASSTNAADTQKERPSNLSDSVGSHKFLPSTAKSKRIYANQPDQTSNSASTLSNASSGYSKTVSTGHFQWRRVATKLGIDRAVSEDQSSKESDLSREIQDALHSGCLAVDLHRSARVLPIDLNGLIELQSSSIESLDDVPQELFDTDDELNLFLTDHEVEAWSVTVDKKTLKKMTAKNIKKQDHIWEFVQTEKSHCRTLKIMHKVFAFGMLQELSISQDMVDRIFPRLNDLLDIHLTLLNRLVTAQRKSGDRSIESIGQILQQQFDGQMIDRMKATYGEFCSLQTESVQLYKDLLKSDVAFQTFIKKCSRNGLCKRLSIPECILLVTQRITKYPLLIEPIIKTSPENSADRHLLTQCVAIIRDIISHVEKQMDARGKELRLFEVYNKLDARSTAMYNTKKFKKSDLLSNKRKLIHDGTLKWMSARGKPFEVLAVVLSDVIFFLADNNQKCTFFSHDNKSSVISLSRLIVREKGDTKDSKGMYLICQSKTEPEMYEFICRSADDRRKWIQIIREAINNCSEDGEPSTFEEERLLQEAADARLRQLIDQLHNKDHAIVSHCREKMNIAVDILEIFAKEDISNYLKTTQKTTDGWKLFMPELIMQSVFLEATRLFALMQPVPRLIGVAQNCSQNEQGTSVQPETDLSSVNEGGLRGSEELDLGPVHIDDLHQGQNQIMKSTNGHHQEPRSCEIVFTKESLTDHDEEGGEGQERVASSSSIGRENPDVQTSGSISQLDSAVTREQCLSMARILQLIHQLVCVSSVQTTELESLFAQLADSNGKVTRLKVENERLSRERRLPGYHPDKHLEELRTLQSLIQQQKSELDQSRVDHMTSVDQHREELIQMQIAVNKEKEDIQRQKDEIRRQRDKLQEQLRLHEEQRVKSRHEESPNQTSSFEDLDDYHRHFEAGVLSHQPKHPLHQSVVGERWMSYDRLQSSDLVSTTSSETPGKPDRPRKVSGHPSGSKAITRMHSMSAVPSTCLSPPVTASASVSRRQSIFLPLQQTVTADQKQPPDKEKSSKRVSRSSSKDSDSSPSRKSSRVSSTTSSSSLSSKLLAAFSSKLPMAAELLRLSKDRSGSLTSVAASQSMPSSPQSLARHAEVDNLGGKSSQRRGGGMVGYSLSSSPPLASESHVLKKRLISTLSTGNFLQMKFSESRRPKSASASPQHSSVMALRHSKYPKRLFTGSQDNIHSSKPTSTGSNAEVFYF